MCFAKKYKIENINFIELETMEKMFYNFSVNQIIFKNIQAPKISSMAEMFSNCLTLREVIFENFEAPNLSNISRMFSNSNIYNYHYIKLDGILVNINVSKLITMEEMFANCNNLDNFTLENIMFLELISMEGMFYSCNNLNFINFNDLHFVKDVSMTNLISNLTNKEINFQNIDAPVCLNIEMVFRNISIQQGINLRNINIPKVKTISKMININNNSSNSPNIILENINFDNVENAELFIDANYINNISMINVNISKLKSMENMFNIFKLKNLYFENLDASNVEKSVRFYKVNLINNIHFKKINFSNLLTLEKIFRDQNELVNIYFFDIYAPNVNSTQEMLYNCGNLKNIYFGKYILF